MVVLEIFAPNAVNATVYYDLLSIVYIVYVTQASRFKTFFFFFLEVRLG